MKIERIKSVQYQTNSLSNASSPWPISIQQI